LSEAIESRCPVCRARFRGSVICSRCGANLEPLMILLAKAYRLRNLASQALGRGNYQDAERFATEAQAICYTRKGRDLQRFSTWLLRESGRTAAASPLDVAPITSHESTVARQRGDGPAAVYLLLLAGIAGLGWAVTARAVQWLGISRE
jgi:hypothetical protein